MKTFFSINPATGETVWTGSAAMADDVDRAVSAARDAFPAWSARPLEERAAILRAFAGQLTTNKESLAELISREIGKPHWEALTEVQAMIGKIEISIEAHAKRCGEFRSATGVTRFRPHGVVAVLGPFNFPGHLPNGHIAPALLAGNTVVFKPSEFAPLVARRLAECWIEAGLPAGALNLVIGARATGAALVGHPGIDGVYFTGSYEAGRAINRQLADEPGKIVALEMGGNNPLVACGVGDIDAAAYWSCYSAFLTAGQRCASARRLIVTWDQADRLVDAVAALTRRLKVGPYTSQPEPFAGPVISDAAADRLLKAQADLVSLGGRVLVEMRALGPTRAMLSPGVIDMTDARDRPDVELFGPLLQVVRVRDFSEAIAEANRTAYGLSAALFSDERARWETFSARVRAGVVNWNGPTVGASGALPFGGIGHSGNHRPSGAWAADYCSYPVATQEHPTLSWPTKRPPGLG